MTTDQSVTKIGYALAIALVGALIGLAFVSGVNAEKVRANEVALQILRLDIEALKAIRVDIAAIRVQTDAQSRETQPKN